MVRGFYSAAAGMLSKQKSIDIISNNITSTDVAGYKNQSAVESAFADHLVSRVSASPKVMRGKIGTGSFITVNHGIHTDLTQGPLEQTGRSVDLAIQGQGFFLVRSDRLGDLLTRNGQAELDADGSLFIPGIGKVLDDRGREIKLKSADFTVGPEGRIFENGRETARLNIVRPRVGSELLKVGQGGLASTQGYERADSDAYNVMQAFVEKSNVNMARELSRIIAGQSHFQSCSQVLRIYDKINELGVNKIGSID